MGQYCPDVLTSSCGHCTQQSVAPARWHGHLPICLAAVCMPIGRCQQEEPEEVGQFMEVLIAWGDSTQGREFVCRPRYASAQHEDVSCGEDGCHHEGEDNKKRRWRWKRSSCGSCIPLNCSDTSRLLAMFDSQPSMKTFDEKSIETKVATSGTVWSADEEADIMISPTMTDAVVLSPSAITPFVAYTTPRRTTPSSCRSDVIQESRYRYLERVNSCGKSKLNRFARRLSHKEKRDSVNVDESGTQKRSSSLDCAKYRRCVNDAEEKVDSPLLCSSSSLPCHAGQNRLMRQTSGNLSDRSGSSESSQSKEKRKKTTRQIEELLDAVEHQDLETAKELIDHNALDINSYNEDDLTALDIAVMSNHVPMVKMLIARGALENPSFEHCVDCRALKIASLLNEAETKIAQLKNHLLGSTVAQVKENERQLSSWQFKHRLLTSMKQGFDEARPPEPPVGVTLSVASATSLMVKFAEPTNSNGAVVTRYRIQWSCYEGFAPLAGEQILDQPHSYEIGHLVQGNAYYVQVASYNMKGFSKNRVASPPFAVPSSWREVDDVHCDLDDKLLQLDNLFAEVKLTRPADASELKTLDLNESDNSIRPRRLSNVKKMSIKHLFSASPKFTKTLKRGVYLACLFYNGDRILVTNEDMLPVIEVDENFVSVNINNDFHWLMKVACTWEDVKGLRQDMERNNTSSTMMFRCKLLQTLNMLQNALGVEDLGQFYHSPTRDKNGSIVLTLVRNVRSPKQLTSMHVHWAALTKIQKRVPQTRPPNAAETVLLSTQDIISYGHSSNAPLPKGLYLCYLKLKSSVDLINIVVPQLKPNILPFVRVRHCPCVTRDEWEWLRNLSRNETQATPSVSQAAFHDELASASKRLLEKLDVSEEEAISHRLYDKEVIELSEDVSCLLVLPPVEDVCSIPGHADNLNDHHNSTNLPVQVFEMIHMRTYKHEFISRYSRLSCILEIDTHHAQQTLREAFSSVELTAARQRVSQLADFQRQLDEAWKSLRWTMDIINYARDKSLRGGLPLGVLRAGPPHSTSNPPPPPPTDAASVGQGVKCADTLTVYARYETGLADGACVRLRVTRRTCARTVVRLVVEQLNHAVERRGFVGPLYSDDAITADFCLVAMTTVGKENREMLLPADCPVLPTVSPKRKLCVKLKRDVQMTPGIRPTSL